MVKKGLDFPFSIAETFDQILKWKSVKGEGEILVKKSY